MTLVGQRVKPIACSKFAIFFSFAKRNVSVRSRDFMETQHHGQSVTLSPMALEGKSLRMNAIASEDNNGNKSPRCIA